MPDQLSPMITVHCFWCWCPHTEHGLNPVTVHDQMEAHYRAVHTMDLARLGY